MNVNFDGKKVGIIGLGVEGLSSLKFYKFHGAEVSVREIKEESQLDKEVLLEARNYTSDFLFGKDYLTNLLIFDIIVRSPGVRPDLPQLLEATREGIRLTSNMKAFLDISPAKIIGVTGTKGKGTTTTLISEMLKKSGGRAFVGGNIGIPPLDLIDQLSRDDWIVLEMSSFQLIDMQKSPKIAVVLMVTTEHLDWHKSTQEYIKAKANIVSHQNQEDFAIINVDHPGSSGLIDKTNAKKILVSLFKEQNPGVYLKNEIIVRNVSGKVEEILPVKEVFLRGRHNIENIAAAAAAVSIAGVGVDEIAQVAREFKGLEHRLEFVQDVNGIKYYNDSFSTTPETAIAAIKSFREPLVVILGGSDKGSDYSELGKEINLATNIKGIILIGQTAEKISKTFDRLGKYKDRVFEGQKTMQEIVAKANSMSSSGDVILLSPASASFGMFKNYKDRGEQFKNIVNSIN